MAVISAQISTNPADMADMVSSAGSMFTRQYAARLILCHLVFLSPSQAGIVKASLMTSVREVLP